MVFKHMKHVALAIVAALSPVAANAQLVSTQNQTVDGQDFVFNFNTTGAPTGPGLLTLLIRGDFSGDFPGNESYDFNLEGVISGTNLGLNTGALVQSYGFDDNLFSQSFALSQAQLFTLTADNQIVLNVNFAPGVSSTLSANPYVTARIDFPTAAAVPEPATWALMLLGFGAIGTAARRRRKAVGLAIA